MAAKFKIEKNGEHSFVTEHQWRRMTSRHADHGWTRADGERKPKSETNIPKEVLDAKKALTEKLKNKDEMAELAGTKKPDAPKAKSEAKPKAEKPKTGK